MKNNSLKTNGFLKTVGVILLIVLCAITSFAGYVFVYYNYAGGTSSYYDTNECYVRLEDRARQRVENIIYNMNDGIEAAGNESYRIEECDGWGWNIVDGQSLGSVIDYDHVSYALYYANPDSLESWGYGIYNYYYTNRNQVEEQGLADGEKAYLVITCLNDPTSPSDLFAEEYSFYATVGSYVNMSVPVMVACLWAALVIIILEMIGAGHRKGYDGIFLSWFDRIPLDLLTIVIGMIVAGAGALTALYFEAFHGMNVRTLINLVTPISGIEVICLLLYFYLISIAVRIKSHTFFSNNLISKLFSGVFGTFNGFYRWINGIYRSVRESSSWWLGFVVAAYGLGIFTEIVFLGRTGIWGLAALVITVIGGYAVLQCGRDFKVLSEAVDNLSAGKLDYRIDEMKLNDMKGPFYRMGRSFDEIGNAMETAVNEKMKSERMKTELITNVSHDLKTPLTSIINYVDLLKKEHTEEQEKEYLDVLDRQRQRLRVTGRGRC